MYYLLDKDKNPFPSNIEQVIRNLDMMKNVKKDVINQNMVIHTVFSFFNLLKNDDKLYLFETKVIKDGVGIHSVIYQTYNDALNGHNILLKEFNEEV